jgi:hypothetical protein
MAVRDQSARPSLSVDAASPTQYRYPERLGHRDIVPMPAPLRLHSDRGTAIVVACDLLKSRP